MRQPAPGTALAPAGPQVLGPGAEPRVHEAAWGPLLRPCPYRFFEPPGHTLSRPTSPTPHLCGLPGAPPCRGVHTISKADFQATPAVHTILIPLCTASRCICPSWSPTPSAVMPHRTPPRLAHFLSSRAWRPLSSTPGAHCPPPSPQPTPRLHPEPQHLALDGHTGLPQLSAQNIRPRVAQDRNQRSDAATSLLVSEGSLPRWG